MRILIVEDEHNSRLAIESLLDSLGFEVAGAESAAEAERLVEDGFLPDLMVCDWMLRGGDDGVQLATRLTRDNPDLEIVFVTGQALDELQRAAAHLNVLSFLAKPFTLMELKAVLEKAESGGMSV